MDKLTVRKRLERAVIVFIIVLAFVYVEISLLDLVYAKQISPMVGLGLTIAIPLSIGAFYFNDDKYGTA